LKTLLRALVVLFVVLTVLTGLIYPFAVTGIGSLLFPHRLDAVKERIAQLHAADPGNGQPIPVDLVTASASALDPEESPAAALYQVPRVARARHLDPAKLRQFVLKKIEPPQWGVFGEPRVNVLMLNLDLDRAQ